MVLTKGQFKVKLIKIADNEKLPRNSRTRKRFFDFAIKLFGRAEYPDFDYISQWAHRFYMGTEHIYATGDAKKTLISIDGSNYGMQDTKTIKGKVYKFLDVCTTRRCADRFKKAYEEDGKNVYIYYYKCPKEEQWGIYVR